MIYICVDNFKYTLCMCLDINGDGFLDQQEIEALFKQEVQYFI